MNLREVTMKHNSLIVFIRPDPAEVLRLVRKLHWPFLPEWEGPAPVFSVLLWVVFLALVAQIRGFLLNKA
jgi:hypothetical protein